VELRNHEINLSLGRRMQNGLTREEDGCNLQILGGMKNKKNSNGDIIYKLELQDANPVVMAIGTMGT
jgi:hypothetical protein